MYIFQIFSCQFWFQTFQGNSDRASEVKHVLYESVEAHYLRILPGAYHGAVCMRIEVFGVKRKPGYYFINYLRLHNSQIHEKVSYQGA